MLTTNSLRLRPYNNRQITRILVLILALTTQLQNCQTHQQQATTHGNGDCSHRHHLRPQQHQQVASGASRQQRQFSPRMAQMVASTLPASNPIMKTVELEHEEFNLGASNQQANLSTAVLQQQIATHREDSQLRTATDGATNTTPAQPNDSIGSPVAPQPPVTTSSSLLASNSTTVEMSSTGQPPEVFGKENSQVHARPAQQARQMPDRETGDGLQQQVRQSQYYGPSTESSSSTGHFSHSENNHHMVSSLAQSVSSSPSSISIITPLMSPDQHQKHQPAQVTQTLSASIGNEQSTGMMKPIFVVGNPISERDYAGPHYETSAAASQLYQPQPVQGQPQLATSPPLENSKPAAGSTSNMIPKVRMEKLAENQTTSGQSDRIDGPPLVYSDGQLTSQPVTAAAQQQVAENGTLVNSAAMPRLLQPSGAAVLGNNLRRPSLPPPVNQANAASGFRSPMSPSGSLVGTAPTVQPQQPQQQQQVPPMQQQALQPPANNMVPQQMGSFYQSSAPYAGVSNLLQMNTMYGAGGGANGLPTGVIGGPSKPNYATMLPPPSALAVPGGSSSAAPHTPSNSISYTGRRPLNITRVEHISAECSDDLIRAAIVFNGTFKGIIYSSGYVNDPTCLYVNGTGATRYEFGIRLNQCGTLGRQELHQPTIPGEARRRDQVMWNTLSIQYNSIIEQEWDEHFRVSCEYGSDFWKTVSFSPFNVETNTGSPVVFTINPPQCQMDVLLGHGMGPKIAVDGPVTVGDPLTLLIHMKSEKAGYDILVKNCVAHNGGKQRMQLIDSNGCVVNERFISPFRGTYNDNDLRHVTLYAYLKAFRFTGSPVLYLECEIHMCQSACPPQMCYWRRLSKRSVDQSDYEYTTNQTAAAGDSLAPPVISDSLNLFKALQVRQESEPSKAKRQMQEIRAEDEEATLVCYRHTEVLIFLTTIASLLVLVVTIAVTCCLRVRKLSRRASQLLGDHKLLGSTAGSLSPSLLSISDALCNASTLSGSLLSLGGQSANDKSLWLYQKQHRQRPTCPIADRSPVSQSNRRPPSSSFHHGQPQAFNSPRAR